MLQLPIGLSDFKQVREGGYTFVDKSDFIREVLETSSSVLLIPRPRRFGKTLNLSMLHCFLDPNSFAPGLFAGLAISEQGRIMAMAGQAPTLFLSFKDLKQLTWDACASELTWLLARLVEQHRALIEAASPHGLERKLVDDLREGRADLVQCGRALALLTELLHRASGRKVYVLLDEYDTPIHAGHQYGYEREVVAFMRSFLGGALKDNRSLEKGILTGVMRVARESIFSGLNNLDVFAPWEAPFSRQFGFTEAQVQGLLTAADQDDRLEELRTWYNGYQFGQEVIYNPWSILKAVSRPTEPCQPHWLNTSDNALIRDLIMAGALEADDLAALMTGAQLERELDVGVSFDGPKQQAIWTFLLFGGYLTTRTVRMGEARLRATLAIPNREVATFYESTLNDWLSQLTPGNRSLDPLFEALWQRDVQALSERMNALLKHLLSFHDTAGDLPERVYHAFFLGLLAHQRDRFEISSNRESGYGRYDLALIPRARGETGYLLEFKRADDGELESAAAKALAQIRQRDYAAVFVERGIEVVYLVGIGIDGKRLAVTAAVATK